MSQRSISNTILIVDDEIDDLRFLAKFLKRFGFQIQMVDNGPAALKQASQKQPDIILLDILMPEMNGFELCRRLKQDETTAEIPIIFMTALTETRNKVRGLEIGAVDYIDKPFQLEEILARLKRHLTLQRLKQKLTQKNKALEQEVKEHKQTTLALRKSETKYRFLTENIHDVIWRMDAELTHFTYLSPSIDNLLGYTPEEMNQISVTEHLLSPYQETIENAVKIRLASEQAGLGDDEIRRWETQCLHKAGHKVWVETITRPVRSRDGQFQGLIGVTRDISENKEIEEKLQSTQVLLSKIFDTDLIGITITRKRDGRFLKINPGFSKITGYTKQELLGRTITDLGIYSLEQREQLLSNLAPQGFLPKQKICFRTKNGSKRWGLFSFESIAAEEEICLLTFLQDITHCAESD